MEAMWAEHPRPTNTRRHDLVPNLVSVVEGYATHERGTLDEITLARSAAVSAQSVQEQAHAEAVLSGALGRLFANVESYPELQAEERFQDLQDELSKLENTIALARSAYNLTVQAYNKPSRRSRRTSSPGPRASSGATFSLPKSRTGTSATPQSSFPPFLPFAG